MKAKVSMMWFRYLLCEKGGNISLISYIQAVFSSQIIQGEKKITDHKESQRSRDIKKQYSPRKSNSNFTIHTKNSKHRAQYSFYAVQLT